MRRFLVLFFLIDIASASSLFASGRHHIEMPPSLQALLQGHAHVSRGHAIVSRGHALVSREDSFRCKSYAPSFQARKNIVWLYLTTEDMKAFLRCDPIARRLHKRLKSSPTLIAQSRWLEQLRLGICPNRDHVFLPDDIWNLFIMEASSLPEGRLCLRTWARHLLHDVEKQHKELRPQDINNLNMLLLNIELSDTEFHILHALQVWAIEQEPTQEAYKDTFKRM